MKKSPFQKYVNSYAVHLGLPEGACKFGWNGAINKIHSLIKRRNNIFEGNWYHEDIDILMEDLRKMIEK